MCVLDITQYNYIKKDSYRTEIFHRSQETTAVEKGTMHEQEQVILSIF